MNTNHLLRAWLVTVAVVGVSCVQNSLDEADGAHRHEGSPSPRAEAALAMPRADVVAWTAEGALAVLDGRTGALRAQASPTDLLGERDLSYDPQNERVFVFESDADDQWGEITHYAISTDTGGSLSFGPRVHRAWVDGTAKLLASPFGVVVFEMGYGERWKTLLDTGTQVASLLQPVPASAWIHGTSASPTISALAYGDMGAQRRVDAPLSPDALGPAVSTLLPVPVTSSPPTARLIPAPLRSGAVLLDVAGDQLVIRLSSGGAVSSATMTQLPASGLGIEDAAALEGGEIVLVLLSGESQLLALELDPDAEILSQYTLPLPGEVRQATRFVSRDLAVLSSGRALVATSEGVFAIVVNRSTKGVELSFDDGFDGTLFRGPLAAIVPKSN